MTIPLDHVVPGDWNAVDRNRQALQSFVIDTGARSVGIRFGSTTVAFTAAVNSAVSTVSHGLGTTPVAVFTGCVSAVQFWATSNTVNATTVDIYGHTVAAFTGNLTVYWLVIG